MLDKIVLFAGLAGVGGYVYHTISSVDPEVFPYSQEQSRAILIAAKTTLPRRDGPGQIQFWSTGRSAKGVALNLQYASWAPVLDCEAVVTAVAPDRSRVVPDCTKTSKSDSALARTQDELRVPMFEEHIRATLNKRAFDRKRVERSESAAVFRNLGGMRREALRSADEAQRESANLGR